MIRTFICNITCTIYIAKMFSQKLAPPIPPNSNPNMSYFFGPHMLPMSKGIYFQGDNRVIRIPSDKIERFEGAVPSWLVADWMLSKKRGEPISAFAQEVLRQGAQTKALKWLEQVLNQ